MIRRAHTDSIRSRWKRRPGAIVSLFLVALMGCLPAGAAQAGGDDLTLRIEDSLGVPGELIAVVIRTYSPRGLTQGQLCLRPRVPVLAAGGGTVLEGLEDFEVFATDDEVTFDVTFDPQTGAAMLTFQSATAGVNETDGPLAVLYYRVSDQATPGDEIEIEIDPGETFLFEGENDAVPVDLRSGTFEWINASDPLEVAFDDIETAQGSVAMIALETERSLPLDSGVLLIDFDPALVAADFPLGFEIISDPRYGAVDVIASFPAAGQIRLHLESPDLTFNRLPGDVLTLRLPLSPSIAVDSVWQIGFDQGSFLESADGEALGLLLTPGEITILPPIPLFSDGFESGGLGPWL